MSDALTQTSGAPWNWTIGFPPDSTGYPIAKQQQRAAESLLRKLGRSELGVQLGSMMVWEPLYNVDDCGLLRRFNPATVLKFIDEARELPETLEEDEKALLAALEGALRQYPEG